MVIVCNRSTGDGSSSTPICQTVKLVLAAILVILKHEGTQAEILPDRKPG
jgi:hypothetical protein